MPTPGYHGRYLLVDLETSRAESIELSETVLRRHLGGSGLGTWLLLEHGAAAIEPLDPAAPLIFALSPLVGSPLTTSAKFAVVSRSPLTERINDSLAGSQFAIEAKKTGHDAILIVGRAAVPSLLTIDDGAVRVEPADDLWGLTCQETESTLHHRLGKGWSVATIGPAGERLVRFATISHDGRHAGRGGSGTVMGSKNLKAIAVRGTRRVTWARPRELVGLARSISERSFGPATAKYRELGTASNLLAFNRLHALPTMNFQQGSFAPAERIAPEQLALSREKAQKSCAACTIGCEHIYGLSPSVGEANGLNGSNGVRLEYENLFALGPLCGIDDPEVVLRASRRCDELGMDTISAGGTIAFAMECSARRLIDEPWLSFGDGEALLGAIDQIAAREGLGDLLAEGSRKAAERIGQGAIDFAPQVKGLEIPGYEPRALQTMALGFAVGTRGADHNRSSAYEADFSEQVDRRRLGPDSVRLAIEAEDRSALIDSLILCKFLRKAFDDLYAAAAEMLGHVTGWDVTPDELRQTAQRIVNAKKLFNVRSGWTPKDDTLPERFLQAPLPDDPQAHLSRADLAAAIRAYNTARGWSDDGFPLGHCLA